LDDKALRVSEIHFWYACKRRFWGRGGNRLVYRELCRHHPFHLSRASWVFYNDYWSSGVISLFIYCEIYPALLSRFLPSFSTQHPVIGTKKLIYYYSIIQKVAFVKEKIAIEDNYKKFGTKAVLMPSFCLSKNKIKNQFSLIYKWIVT
jgi:hypothetical protein